MALVDLIAVDFMETKRPLRTKVGTLTLRCLLPRSWQCSTPACAPCAWLRCPLPGSWQCHDAHMCGTCVAADRPADARRAAQALGYALLFPGSLAMGIVAIWA